MSDYNWCHGPHCHTRQTQDRVRGVKGSKVLRTKKIGINNWNKDTIWRYFCCNNCEYNFISEHIDEFIRLHPRTEALETPIDVKVETRTDYYGKPYKQKVIQAIDNA
jgi:hypothetical protein